MRSLSKKSALSDFHVLLGAERLRVNEDVYNETTYTERKPVLLVIDCAK